MAKAVIAYSGTTFGTQASNGSQPVIFTPHQNPDHTAVKDTRT